MPLYEYYCKKCNISGIDLQVPLADIDKVVYCRDVMKQIDSKKKCGACNEVLVRLMCPVPFKIEV